MDLSNWKTAAKAGPAPAEALLKGYTPDQIKAEDGKYSFTISTGAVDRDKDTLAVDGWRLDRFRKNPVVLLNHDRSGLPIAKAETVLASGGQLKARIVFADYPLAQTVKGLVDGRFMGGASVGFMPLKWTFNEERGGVDFLEQELLEFSIVSVPSNPEALLDAKHAGVDLAPLKDWAVKTLDGMEPGLWLPKDVAARALKSLSGEPASIVVPAPQPESEPDKDTPAPVEKRGRALSAANESRLRQAKDHLDGVLASVGMDEDEDEPKAVPVPAVETKSETSEPVKPEPITAEQLHGLVTAAVGAAVRRLQGRLED